MNHDDLHLLTGAYALDALPPEEQRAFEDHLETCADCRREVAELRRVAAEIGSSQATPPPQHLRSRVLERIRQTPQLPTEPAERSPRAVDRPGAPAPGMDASQPASRERITSLLDRMRSPPALAAAASVIVLVLGVGALVAEKQARIAELEFATEQMHAVLTADELVSVQLEGEAIGRLHLDPEQDLAVFVADGLSPVDEDSTYALWLIDDAGPRSAGLMRPDDDGEVMHILAAEEQEFAAVGLTVEPAGGSPQPTGDLVLYGER